MEGVRLSARTRAADSTQWVSRRWPGASLVALQRSLATFDAFNLDMGG